MTQQGISTIKLLLVIGGCAILILINVFLVRDYRARNRDAVRLSDMAVIQSAMHRLYTDQADYTLDDSCVAGSLLVSDECNQKLQAYIATPSSLVDPAQVTLQCNEQSCGQEPCQYTVGEAFGESSYRVYFTLEKGIAGINAGCHYLDQNGIN